MTEVRVFVMDGRGGGAAVPVDGRRIDALRPALPGRFVWINVDLGSPGGRDWLKGAGLDPIAYDALTAEETRPRCTLYGDMVLINLRGVNPTGC